MIAYTALLLIAGGFAGWPASAARPQPSRAVAPGKDGALIYTPDARGDQVPDFSFAGYKAGASAIPDAPIRVVVAPVAGDNTARIQAALDYVASLPADHDGIRGAVLLDKGRFEVAGALHISASGVVLRGHGMGADGTLLVATGQDRRTLITLGGTENLKADAGSGSPAADDYVPVGATKLRVAPGHNFRVGQPVLIRRPSTTEWIHELGMDSLGGDRHGGGWRAGSRDVQWERTIAAVDSDTITLDVPLTASLDKALGGGTVTPCSFPGRIAQAGVENLRCESAYDAGRPKNEDHAWIAIAISAAEDAWVRQVTVSHFVGGAVYLWSSARRVTVEDCKSLSPVSENAGCRRNTFYTEGQQTLFQRCYSEEGRHDFATGFCAAGPNVFFQCVANHALADSGPIDSWTTGVLYDNVRIDGNELNLYNRKYRDQQTGWAAANSLLWQCTAAVINCYSPPTATNWAYGCWGQFSGDGQFASSRESIRPDSLYYAQLAARCGPSVLAREDLMFQQGDASSSPTVAQAAELIAASTQPAPTMDEWIDASAQKHPIPVAAPGAKSFEDLHLATAAPATRPASHVVAVRNGWLTRDGVLVVGGERGITWWAGGVRPEDVQAARKKEPNITRFVPGRDGPGLTDDLDQLTDTLRADHVAALRHHYGLWYDTRDTDHERIRRENGDVWPPFYEQPFLRSGTGIEWDGLSQYDLTRYNPWYWNRLRRFADLADQKGLFLIAEHYFQHNILEAGAHWASCPWRSANNINHTGFPEPPPYAGDKRIFMAAQFYDVTNPVRRPIHRAFIRKNLDNFADNQDVIHLTSAEYTGPLAFTQFWVDTVAEWEHETGKRPLVGISATKDVQDAILADSSRAAIISLIDINYWWYQQDGKLYSPKGGENLAPRQFERLYKPRAASFASVVRAVREYRNRYPDKAVLYSADHADNLGWAALMGGASLPSIHVPLPAELLAAIPAMRPLDLAGSPADQWALADPGHSYLIYSASAATIHVDLSTASGSFAARWIAPQSGQISPVSPVPAGRPVDLQAPTTSGPWVLWLDLQPNK